MENCDLSNLNISEDEKQWYLRPGRGIPVGSYLSQYLANYYLTFFDHWLKEDLHCNFVIRYMDDIVIFSNSKEQLWNWFEKIRVYLKDELDLDIKSNYQVFPTDIRGVDFVGYRHFRGYKLLRKSTLKTCKETAKKMENCNINKKLPNDKLWCAWVSSIGWIEWCDGKTFYNKYYKDSIPIINTYYNIYKKGKYKRANYQFTISSNEIKKFQKKYFYPYTREKIHK